MKTIHEILNLGVRKEVRSLPQEQIIAEYIAKISGSKGLIYVGANTGQEIPFLKPYADKIYAFEAIGFSSVWEELLKHKDEKVECINVALSDKEEIAVDFYPASNNYESSSLLKPTKHIEEYSWVNFSNPIKVNTKRLDSYKFYTDCDVLIMDVQGSELNVLNGISSFSNLKIIILEYSSEIYENCCTFDELNEKLSKEGFVYQETYGLYYNETSGNYGGNAIFTKEILSNDNPWEQTENLQGDVKLYYEKLESYFTRFKNEIFIETGTYVGNGLNSALNSGYDKCYSIEIHNHLYEKAKKRFSEKITSGKVKLFCGDSSLIFNYILLGLDKPATFWLDAHVSSQYGDMISKNCPVLEELEAIKNHHIKTHTIMIDDVRIFGTELHDNITVDHVVQKIKEINPEYKIEFLDSCFYQDVLVAYI